MKFEQFKNAMDSHFQSNGNMLNVEYLQEHIHDVFMNTSEIQEQVENFRVRPYNPPFMALTESIKGILQWEEVDGMPTTKQIEKYFAQYGYDYKEILAPFTQEVIETRQELKENNSTLIR